MLAFPRRTARLVISSTLPKNNATVRVLCRHFPLIGAVVYRRVMTDDPIDPDRIAGLIGIVLGGPDFEQR